MKRKYFILFFIGWILIFLSQNIGILIPEKHLREKENDSFREFIDSRGKILEQEIEKILHDSSLIKADFSTFRFKDIFYEKGIGWICYDRENIFFWSTNQIPVSSQIIRNKPTKEIWKLKNGWYLAKRIRTDSCQILVLGLLRKEYSYQNDYLSNMWEDGKEHPFELVSSDEKTSSIKHYTEPVTLNSIFFRDQTANHHNNHGVFEWLTLISGLLIVLTCGHFWVFSSTYNLPKISYLFFLVILRVISIVFKIPEQIYHLSIFDPSYFAASPWLPTLGDFLINALFFLYSAWLIFIIQPTWNKDKKLPAIFLVGFGVLFFIFLEITDLIRSLIFNSNISIDFSDFSNFSPGSFVVYLIISILFIGFFLLAEKWHGLARENKIKLKTLIFIYSFLTIAFVVIEFYSGSSIPFNSFVSGLTILLLSIVSFKSNFKSYNGIIFLVILFSITGNILIFHYSDIREREKRKVYAVKLAAERDPLAENLFRETENYILSDSTFKDFFSDPTKTKPEIRDFSKLYFSGYWEKFNITYSAFGKDECPVPGINSSEQKDPLVFDRLIDSIGEKTQSKNLFFMQDGSGKINYLARLKILDSVKAGKHIGTFYIEFQERYIPEELGYPELLLDKLARSNADLASYHYARYINNKLVSHFGSYPYPISLSLIHDAENQAEYFKNQQNFNHLIYHPSKSNAVILSLKEKNLIAKLSPFSCLMLLFGLLLLILISIMKLFGKKKKGNSFRQRIQLMTIITPLVSFLLIGGGTLYYIIQNAKQKNMQALSEKIHSLLIETEFSMQNEINLNPFKASDVAYQLTKHANMFFSDINIFDLSGQLYASSRPKVFDEGLISRKMNPEAFYQLKVSQTSEFIQEENIGRLKYLSAYVPIQNKGDKVIGYLNLPYFARQGELQNEIAAFLIAVINAYVLLIIIVLVIAVILSDKITEPLGIIQEKLGKIVLGEKNEEIEWKGNDEIAKFISEYNRMIGELSVSAEKLAKSERESAWREMARQVAHEIKNPLTPIKLSIQHLKKAREDKAPDFDERLDRFSKTLIEQIDTLSNIASAFSDFAQMPGVKSQPVDIAELIGNVVMFYSGAGTDMHIDFINQTENKAIVLSDKDQLIRVLNNVIRNAIQSIPETRKGMLKIFLNKRKNQYEIRIKDNGSGIKDENRESIFNPNFTTRTGGMGLGLALSKNILESFGGAIQVEETSEEGTIFLICLPEYASADSDLKNQTVK